MARYVRDLVLNKPDDFVQFMMNDYLQKNGKVRRHTVPVMR